MRWMEEGARCRCGMRDASCEMRDARWSGKGGGEWSGVVQSGVEWSGAEQSRVEGSGREWRGRGKEWESDRAGEGEPEWEGELFDGQWR
jgi:hypothetical protein